jgi:type I restriction enzyme S subunit
MRLESIPGILSKFRSSIISLGLSGELTNEWRRENQSIKKVRKTDLSGQQATINNVYKETYKIPSSWKWEALGNIANCSRGRFSVRPRNDPRYFTGKYPFIQIGDLPRNGGYIESHSQTVNEKGLKATKVFNKDTIAIAIVGATIGNTGILPYDLSFPDSLVGIDSGNPYTNLFIEFYLRLEKDNLRKLSYAGGGQPNIKLENIKNYPIPVPPPEEQKVIVDKINSIVHQNEQIHANYIKASEMLELIKSKLFEKAFKGLLTNQKEPPVSLSKLLADIQEEKKQTEKEKLTNAMKAKINRQPKGGKKSTIEVILRKKFKKKTFSFSQCEKQFDNEEYDFLKNDFFELINSKKLEMTFNAKSKTYEFAF